MTTGRINQVTILTRAPEGAWNPPRWAEQFTVAEGRPAARARIEPVRAVRAPEVAFPTP